MKTKETNAAAQEQNFHDEDEHAVCNHSHIITDALLDKFASFMEDNEKSLSTIHKYLADLHKLIDFAGGQPLTRQMMIDYKNYLLTESYELSSINSYLAAASCFLDFMGCNELKVQMYKLQKQCFYPEDKYLTREEYRALVMEARERGLERLAMILNTICSTGIRISELKYITVESLQKGRAVIHCKGKIRVILMSKELLRCLKEYAGQHNITEGIIFRTASGNPVDRSNIWRQMKSLCREAGVPKEKVFPHNLRHLFARTFYEEGKDISKLADVLGHSSIETTRIYIMTSCEEHRKYLEQMNLLY